MKHQIVVHAVWDDEAKVWVARSDDVQGLAIEAETVESLKRKVVPAIEDLIELNDLKFASRTIPVEIRVEEHTTVSNPSL